MPIYEYHCDSCNEEKEVFLRRMRPCKTIECKCGKKMTRLFSQVNTDLVNNERWSWAMGVNQRQIPEAMKRYPGSVYNSKGQCRVSHRKEKLKRMKQRGLVEFG